MKQLFRIMLVASLIALPLLAAAGDEKESPGTASMGIWGTTVTDSPDMVSEYGTTEGGPVLGLHLTNFGDWGSLLVSAHARHADDSALRLDFAVLDRTVRSHTSSTKFLHRLGHDPMSNLDSTSINGKVVFGQDHNPWQDYTMTYSVLEHRTEVQVPDADALTLAVTFRQQHREGHKQTFAVSHCDTCHVNSMSHPINERTTDAGLEAKVAWRGGNVRALYNVRQLRQNFPSLQLTYDDALHPELRKPLFDNRLQYDSAQGQLPVDLWPDQDKYTARLDFNLSNVAGFAVNGGGVWSQTENLYTGLTADYSGYMINAARRFKSGWNVRWRGRVYSLQNDTVFVDANEPAGIAGPHVGKTYRDAYGFDPDFLRESSLDRSVFESNLDAGYRFGRKAGTVRFEWRYKGTDRDYYLVTPTDTKTTTNVLGVSWRARPAKGWKLNARYRHADVNNPFMALGQQASTLVSSPVPNPFGSSQYYVFHDARVGDGTASPSSWDELKLGTSYTAGSTMISGSYRWWDGENTDGSLTDWSRTNQSATLTLWSAPAARWEWYLGYAWQDSSLDAPTTIPIFDG